MQLPGDLRDDARRSPRARSTGKARAIPSSSSKIAGRTHVLQHRPRPRDGRFSSSTARTPPLAEILRKSGALTDSPMRRASPPGDYRRKFGRRSARREDLHVSTEGHRRRDPRDQLNLGASARSHARSPIFFRVTVRPPARGPKDRPLRLRASSFAVAVARRDRQARTPSPMPGNVGLHEYTILGVQRDADVARDPAARSPPSRASSIPIRAPRRTDGSAARSREVRAGRRAYQAIVA